MTFKSHSLAALLVLLAAAASPAAADEIADFYKGKTFTILAAHQSGTGFDLYARTLQRHIRRHIPGNPSVVVQNMPGAGGVVGANWLYNVAPKDGTVMGTFVFTVPFEPLLGNTKARFDPAKFNWIGNMEEGVAVCGVSKAAGIGTFEDMRQKEVVIAGSAPNGALTKSAVALRNLFGVKMKVVPGYKGTASIKIAITRGEAHGVCSILMSTVTSHWRDMYDSGDFRPIIQLSGRARIGKIPHVDDFVKTDEDRQVHALIFGVQALGKLYVAPPDIPGARREALRKALLATMKDPAFVADAAKTKMDVSAMSGQQVEAFIANASKASPAVIERVKRAYAP
ncbi:MAG: Bug family tripartite tricarboxylate transporter substrate binding protein [Xanthobacteraceae bacterium]